MKGPGNADGTQCIEAVSILVHRQFNGMKSWYEIAALKRNIRNNIFNMINNRCRYIQLLQEIFCFSRTDGFISIIEFGIGDIVQ